MLQNPPRRPPSSANTDYRSPAPPLAELIDTRQHHQMVARVTQSWPSSLSCAKKAALAAAYTPLPRLDAA